MNGNIIEEMLLEELNYRAAKTGRSIQSEAQRFLNHQPKDEALYQMNDWHYCLNDLENCAGL